MAEIPRSVARRRIVTASRPSASATVTAASTAELVVTLAFGPREPPVGASGCSRHSRSIRSRAINASRKLALRSTLYDVQCLCPGGGPMKIGSTALSLNVADTAASADFAIRHFGFTEEMSADGFVSLTH